MLSVLTVLKIHQNPDIDLDLVRYGRLHRDLQFEYLLMGQVDFPVQMMIQQRLVTVPVMYYLKLQKRKEAFNFTNSVRLANGII